VSNNSIKILAKVCPLVFIPSKRLRVTLCFGCQLAFKKLITYGKISRPPFDINKSKLVVAKWHSIKVGKTYNCLVFIKKKIPKGKTSLGHKCILNHLNQIFFTNGKANGF